mmetsp:Transcript_27231/g.49985  ORF Transcript_27231/g.49985 Transcript_27231/m.49985 type:complete len:465 (+) Transcript_27231:58-1452(+)
MVKRALCVGLNYPDTPHQLYGCVNDCLNWAFILEKDLGFDECRILIDQNPDGSLATAKTQVPTKANILSQLCDWLCASTQPGDVAAFVFAGHGVQVKAGGNEIEEALIPEDFEERDRYGNPSMIMEDDIHTLLAGLPSGALVTLILDASHAAHMLDVPCSIDSTNQPHKVCNTVGRPREVRSRNEHPWRRSTHAYARPRFLSAVELRGSRSRQKPPGLGAHVGRMTIGSGVTAFCFAASRCHETALDCSIKSHQQGAMSFCLQEALQQLKHRCTYEQLLSKASDVADDIREKYMPSMDQHFHLSFSPNAAPSEVVFLDARYASVAEHKMRQGVMQRERGNLGVPTHGPQHPMQESETDFVPAPKMRQQLPTAGQRNPQMDRSSKGVPQAAPQKGAAPNMQGYPQATRPPTKPAPSNGYGMQRGANPVAGPPAVMPQWPQQAGAYAGAKQAYPQPPYPGMHERRR